MENLSIKLLYLACPHPRASLKHHQYSPRGPHWRPSAGPMARHSPPRIFGRGDEICVARHHSRAGQGGNPMTVEGDWGAVGNHGGLPLSESTSSQTRAQILRQWLCCHFRKKRRDSDRSMHLSLLFPLSPRSEAEDVCISNEIDTYIMDPWGINALACLANSLLSV